MQNSELYHDELFFKLTKYLDEEVPIYRGTFHEKILWKFEQTTRYQVTRSATWYLSSRLMYLFS